MLTFEQLVKRVSERFPALDRRELEDVAFATIETLGFHLSSTGEICDPRPKPVIIPPNNQVHARWSGSRRRR